ncbi:hypothetical protein ACFL02_04530 [Planctomycetota bacterium]
MHLSKILSICMLVLAVSCDSTPPEGTTDEFVRQLFISNKEVFEELHLMIQEDSKVKRVGDDVVGDDWFKTSGSTLNEALESAGLSRERYDIYMKLLRCIGAYRVSCRASYAGATNDTIIGIHRWGIVPEGFTLDVIYTLESIYDPFVEDTIEATRRDNTQAYLPLGGCWYIRRVHD